MNRLVVRTSRAKSVVQGMALLQDLQENQGDLMPRPANLKRDTRIIELRAQGFTMRQIAEQVGVSTAAVHRALQPVNSPEQLLAYTVRRLEERIEVLENQAVISEEFMQLVARVSAHWGYTFRDQIIAIIHRWPKPSVVSPTPPIKGPQSDVSPKPILAPKIPPPWR